jgi:hypothetical protein
MLVLVVGACASAVPTSSALLPTGSATPATSTPTPTPTPSATASPTPTPSPAPWWEAFANAQTVPIDQVPLQTDLNGFPAGGGIVSYLGADAAPWFIIEQQGGTITAIVPDQANGILWVAVTGAGDGLTHVEYQTACLGSAHIQGCIDVTWPQRFDGGATLWWAITEDTGLSIDRHDANFGLQQFVGKLRLGMRVYEIYPGLRAGLFPGGDVTSTQAAANMAALARLEQSVGHAYPRSDLRFSFYAATVALCSDDIATPNPSA